jgi:hypothetical protein
MKHLVYAQFNPETGEITYIGAGTRQRIRKCSPTTRSGPHLVFLQNLRRMGYMPRHYTVVLAEGLTKEEAHAVERQLIETVKPIFNYKGVASCAEKRMVHRRMSELSDDEVRSIRIARKKGLTYSDLSETFNLNNSSLHGIVQGRFFPHVV